MEFHEDIPVSIHLNQLEMIADHSSALQSVKLYQHSQLGKVLIINDEIQHIEAYAYLYHEPLVHLPLSFTPCPQNALILGGGSLYAAYELLKYPSITSVDLCDYDCNVLNAMSSHYSHAKAVIDDQRFSHIAMDARDFIHRNTEKYDIIINDCFDLLYESKKSQQSMFDALADMLTSDGVCSDVIYRHFFEKTTTMDTVQILKRKYRTAFGLIFVPEYPGILHIQTIWGLSEHISQTARKSINQFHAESKATYQYFDPCLLPYYLYLPPFVQNMINQ